MSSSSSYIPPLGPAEGSDRAPGDSQGHPISALYSTKSALPSQLFPERTLHERTSEKSQPNYSTQFILLCVSF